MAINTLFIVQTPIEKLAYAFSWMLIHSLWQGAILAILTFGVLRVYRNASAEARYNFVAFILVLFAFISLSTLYYIYPSSTISFLADRQGDLSVTIQSRATFKILEAYLSAHTWWIIAIWSLLFAAKTFKIVLARLHAQGLKAGAVDPNNDYWQERFAGLAKQLRLNKVIILLESAKLHTPVVLGHFKPIILVPLGMLNGMPTAQLEAVLLHELAHIKRNDYLANFLQLGLEAVFCFNPALRWISGRLREEREHCCDDMALGQTGNKSAFIQALISFRALSLGQPTTAVGFTSTKYPILKRMQRLIESNDKKGVKSRSLLFPALAILALFGCLAMSFRFNPTHKTEAPRVFKFAGPPQKPSLVKPPFKPDRPRRSFHYAAKTIRKRVSSNKRVVTQQTANFAYVSLPKNENKARNQSVILDTMKIKGFHYTPAVE